MSSADVAARRFAARGRCYDRRVVVTPALGRLTDDQRAVRDAVRMLARERASLPAAAVGALYAALRVRAG